MSLIHTTTSEALIVQKAFQLDPLLDAPIGVFTSKPITMAQNTTDKFDFITNKPKPF